MIRARKCNIQCYKYESGQDDRGLPDINVSRFGEARKEMEQKQTGLRMELVQIVNQG